MKLGSNIHKYKTAELSSAELSLGFSGYVGFSITLDDLLDRLYHLRHGKIVLYRAFSFANGSNKYCNTKPFTKVR